MSLIISNSPVDQASLSSYLDRIKSIPTLDQELEQELARKMNEEKDVEAAQKLVMSHLKLVAKIAFGYRGYGLPIIDMISEGNIGLMHAVKKFNPQLGFRLSTYATWWIKASIQEYILKSWSLVKIGTTTAQKKLFFSLRKVKSVISKAESGFLTNAEIDEIASRLDVTSDEVREMDMRMNKSDASLHTLVGEDKSMEAIDLLPDPSANHENMIIAKDEKNYKNQQLTSAFSTLNEREQEVIRNRYMTESAMTLEQISKTLGVSTERVRQIEAKALEKMRNLISAE
ncbi:MAG: RNA polymerase sigma factor RpoH [Alphaproteobacteria bacterium]|nr:RNA polymerase sigma factor RpoH [Alphaproteobacteria bacterium]OJV14045.1 MAG: RNA polymerase factor sigma-32 [Alphaproteobacteria bacterium 33-17]